MVQEISDILETVKGASEPELVVDAIGSAIEGWFPALHEVSMIGTHGQPDWLQYEMRIWELGEKLRPELKKRKWSGNEALVKSVQAICQREELGKGRQTFVILLATIGSSEDGNALGKLIEQTEVRGHCIQALTKLGNFGFCAEVAKQVPELKGWEKTAAKRYLENCAN